MLLGSLSCNGPDTGATGTTEPEPPPPETGVVRVLVSDADGLPVEGASLTGADAGGVTDATGFYRPVARFFPCRSGGSSLRSDSGFHHDFLNGFKRSATAVYANASVWYKLMVPTGTGQSN